MRAGGHQSHDAHACGLQAGHGLTGTSVRVMEGLTASLHLLRLKHDVLENQTCVVWTMLHRFQLQSAWNEDVLKGRCFAKHPLGTRSMQVLHTSTSVPVVLQH